MTSSHGSTKDIGKARFLLLMLMRNDWHRTRSPGRGSNSQGGKCARPRLPLRKGDGPSGVPSHNDHPVVIRPKEEAQRCEHRSVKLLCAQFERFERRQWLSDCSGLVMPPAPSEAGGGRNESGTDDKDAHGVISLFGAPQLNQLQSSQLVPGHPLEEAPTTRPGPPPNQAQSAMNTGPEYWLGHLTLLHHRCSKKEARETGLLYQSRASSALGAQRASALLR